MDGILKAYRFNGNSNLIVDLEKNKLSEGVRT